MKIKTKICYFLVIILTSCIDKTNNNFVKKNQKDTINFSMNFFKGSIFKNSIYSIKNLNSKVLKNDSLIFQLKFKNKKIQNLFKNVDLSLIPSYTNLQIAKKSSYEFIIFANSSYLENKVSMLLIISPKKNIYMHSLDNDKLYTSKDSIRTIIFSYPLESK